MILVAATAVGISLMRDELGSMVRSLRYRAIGVPLLASWSLATLVLRLRRPRPTWRRLTRQPGLVASAATVGAVGAGLAWACMVGLLIGRLKYPDWYWSPSLWFALTFGGWPEATQEIAVLAGGAVAGAWLALAFGGRRRPEPGWADRLGRLVGILWIGQLLLEVWSVARNP